MNPTVPPVHSSIATYRSGVAARLAGVPVETLRVWERRYDVIRPRRSASGQRLYSEEEVRRLTLIKQLLDLGHPIGAVANLPTDQLVAMLSALHAIGTTGRVAASAPPMALQVALVGPTVSSRRFREALLRNVSGGLVELTGHSVNVQGATSSLQNVTADLVIIELPTLNDESISAITQVTGLCGAGKAVILYRFASSSVVRHLREAGHDVFRAPSDPDESAALCQALLQLPHTRLERTLTPTDQRKPSPPRFDERSLAAFAEASSTVYCECPRHLVELVVSLSTFERYSAECVSRSPDDAELHRDLQHTAAQARSLIEDAIHRVAVQDGLSLQPIL